MYLPGYKSSRGFGVIEIVVAVVIIGLIAAGAMVYLQSQKSDEDAHAGHSSAEHKEMMEHCEAEIDDELLCKTFSSWVSTSSEPYTLTSNSGVGTDNESFMTLKSHGDNSHSIMEFDGQTMESMTVDGVSYMKMDGQWYRQDPVEGDDHHMDGMDEDLTDEVDSLFEEEKAAKTEYNRLGTEACGDATCVKYEIYTTDEPDDKYTIWVDEDKARVMRMQMSDGEGGIVDMMYTYGPVDITAPADAKDMSEMMMGM